MRRLSPCDDARARRLGAALLAALLPIAVLAADGPPADDAASVDEVLSALQRLEADHDAKCHSSASRFEDFLFGTPLATEARHANVALQKRVVRHLWKRGSAAAAAEGAASVGPEHLRDAQAELVALATGPDGLPRVASPEVPADAQSEVRRRQYASIAYSLRAILAVQQDLLIQDPDGILPLAPEGIDALRETLDAVSMAALGIADREARERSEFEIREARLRDAWRRLLPDLDPAPALAEVDREGARAEALALLDALAEEKASAYRAYNDLESDQVKLLVFNISRFYARQPLPYVRRERRKIVAALEGHLEAFAARLLARSAASGEDAPPLLMRPAAADAAVRALMPHRIDEFEDVHLFGRLAESERMTLEAFDCDSFRDFGVHWKSLQRAARASTPETPVPDPFAAEILAEAISNYAVALLRLAGEIAGADTEVRVAIPDLARAADVLSDRARRHHAAPEPPPTETQIASAASGSRPAGGVWFSDVTADAGVAFTHRSSKWLGEFRHKQLKTPPTFSGGGVAAEDVDGDGDPDLLFVGGGGNALLRNDGGRFEDVTAEAGLAWRRPDGTPGEARAPILADFDNDGRQDVLVTYVNDDHRLYRNLGGLRFEDVTARAGLGGAGLVGGPATVFDFDGDGLLDVYIGYFGNYLDGEIPAVDRDNRNALPNRLFRNRGGLRFEDVTEASGTGDTGWTQAVSHVDFDRDGRQDLIVANDYGRNAFLANLGGGRFENRATALGVTKAFHSMNVGIADLNDDDHPDVYISNLASLVKDNKYVFPDVDTPLDFDLRAMAGMLVKESDMLYMSQLESGRLSAYAPSRDVERGATSTGWAWDAEFFDFDHDGDDDLYLVNGTNDFNVFSMTYRRFHEDGRETEHVFDYGRDTNVFFENDGGKLRNVSEKSGADFASNSRSTAYLDFDGDGDLDVAVNDFHGPARLLRNDVAKPGRHWLVLRLEGDPDRGSSRDAIGARILVTTESGLRVRREIQGGSGYLSMNPKAQHVGLGAATRADVRITWPNGDVQTLHALEADRRYRLRQGSSDAIAVR